MSFKKASVAKPGRSGRAGSLSGSYALRAANTRSTDKAAGDQRPSLASLIDSKCKINSDAQEATPESSAAAGFPPKSNCRRPQLHPSQNSPAPSPSESRFFTPSSIHLDRWADGPADSAGAVVNLSDRPSLCMSLMGTQAAIGSSDHAVYTVDVTSAQFRKALYGGNRGHTEWVTCISHLPDGRILSGGMDSKLCLWDRTSSRCTDLLAHTASISSLKVAPNGCLALSSSYDKSILLWDLGIGKGSRVTQKPLASLQGHRAPVMAFALGSSCTNNNISNIASGCREGAVILWDACTCSAILQCKQAHSGHVTALECLGDKNTTGPDIFLSGGQDGALQVWDFRVRYPVHRAVLHSSSKGQGALSCISVSSNSACGCPLVVTGGADKLMKVIDPRFSFQVIHTLSDHRDFIYNLFASGSLAWSGSGDGSILVHDLISGKCLYGLGASANGAVRCIGMTTAHQQEYLVCTGDDGNVMIYTKPEF